MLTPETYPTVLAACEEIVKHAAEHYEELGWDLIVECFDDAEALAEHLMHAGVTTNLPCCQHVSRNVT